MAHDDICNAREQLIRMNKKKKNNKKLEDTYSGTKMAELQIAMKALNIDDTYSTKNIDDKHHYKLNKGQKKAYDNMRVLMAKSKNAVILIDCPSGTGKTLLLSTIAANCQKGEVQFIAFRKDQASDLSLKGIQSDTYVSFCMKRLNLSYHYGIRMFNLCGKDEIWQLYSLILYTKKYISKDIKTIMLDTYTVAPPQMLLLLYIIALKNDIHLIFAGSTLQPDAIVGSSLHGQNNFSVVQMFTDMTVNKLSINMRTCDPVFEVKLANFRKAMQGCKPGGRLKFLFNLRYQLYCLFRPKYFAQERFDTVYIAQTHANIKKRLTRFIEHLKTTGTQFVEVPFFYYNEEQQMIPLPKRCSGRFFPYLILVNGYKYIYINQLGVHSIVQLVEILYANNTVDALRVRYVNKNNEVILIKRCLLNYYQILPAYRSWLLRDVIHSDELLQFPLRQYTLTYHAALGRTIETEDVEFNVDCPYANLAYIGLSCVRHDAAIHKIHTERDLLGYVVTEYMEQEHADFQYYYRCPNTVSDKILEYVTSKGINEFIENISWIDEENINIFEAKIVTKYLRFKRSAYKQSDKESSTPLMKLAQFIKENSNVVLNTINMSGTESQNKNEKTNVKKKKSQQLEALSPAYVYLKQEYDMWALKLADF